MIVFSYTFKNPSSFWGNFIYYHLCCPKMTKRQPDISPAAFLIGEKFVESKLSRPSPVRGADKSGAAADS